LNSPGHRQQNAGAVVVIAIEQDIDVAAPLMSAAPRNKHRARAREF